MQNISENLDQLLPLATEAPTCSEHSQSIALDPCGTALNIDAVVLIELPLPLPKPVFMHSDLKGLDSLIHTSMGATRVLACQPSSDEQTTTVTVFYKEDENFDKWVFKLKTKESAEDCKKCKNLQKLSKNHKNRAEIQQKTEQIFTENGLSIVLSEK